MLTAEDLVKWPTDDLNRMVQRRLRAIRFSVSMLKATYASTGFSGWRDLVWEMGNIKADCVLIQNVRKALRQKGDVTPW